MKRSHRTKYGSEGLFDCPTCCVCPALPVSSAQLCLGDAFHGCVQWTGGVVEPPASAAYCPPPHTCSVHVPLPTVVSSSSLPAFALSLSLEDFYVRRAGLLSVMFSSVSPTRCPSWSIAYLHTLMRKYLIRNIIAQSGPV